MVFHSSKRKGIDVGHKLVAVCERANEFLLHVSFGLANADSIISGELLESRDPLGAATEAEIKRLTDLYDHIHDSEVLKISYNVAAARLPPQEVSDRLLRYEAHLSREFDRTLSQLERLQRMRKGQPVPSSIKVEASR